MGSIEPAVCIELTEKTEGKLLQLSKPRWFGEVAGHSDAGHFLTTFLTTLGIFVIYFGQGILLARLLGPVGRGEFGTAVFFPRDILLYVGLLGGIEIVTRYAANRNLDQKSLKYSAATLGAFSGVLTAIAGAVFSVVALCLIDGGAKAYLIPYCLLVCLFVPFEHIHLNVSGVDRGREQFGRFNFNRAVFAAAFPVLVLLLYLAGAINVKSENALAWVCFALVASRIGGLYPTLRGLKVGEWLRTFKESWSHRETGAEEVPSSRSLLRKGGPYALSMFASELFERLDILLILALASVQDSGFYFVALPAAALLTIAPNSLSVFTFNAGADKRKVSMKSALSILGLMTLFQIVSVAVLCFLIPYMIVWFYGEPFRPSIQFVWFLLPAFAMKGLLQALDGYLKGCGKPIIGVWARVVSIFAMLAVVLFCFERFELLSVPLAACVGQAISMMIVTVFVLKEISARQEQA